MFCSNGSRGYAPFVGYDRWIVRYFEIFHKFSKIKVAFDHAQGTCIVILPLLRGCFSRGCTRVNSVATTLALPIPVRLSSFHACS